MFYTTIIHLRHNNTQSHLHNTFRTLKMATFRFLFLVLCYCMLFSRTLSSGNLLNKGGFIFEKVIVNNLNQEFMSFNRQLDTKHLKPLIGNLKGLVNIHDEICTKATAAAGKNVADKMKIQDFGFMDNSVYRMTSQSVLFSPPTSKTLSPEATCAQYGARLPEYRESIKQHIRDMCNELDFLRVPMGIHLNPATNTYVYDATKIEVPQSLFNSVDTFDGKITQKYKLNTIHDFFYKQTKNYRLFLQHCKEDYTEYLTYFLNEPYNAVPPGLICELPHQFLVSPVDSLASKFLYHWIAHSCSRDHPVLVKHVEHTLQEIENIINHQINPTELLTFSQYFPQINGNAGALTDTTTFKVDLTSSPSDFLNPVAISSKVKRSTRVNSPKIPIISSEQNFTLIEPDQFLTHLNLSCSDIQDQLFQFTNNTKPNTHQIEEFILTNALHSNTNSTYQVVRQKRGLITAIIVIIAGSAALATVFYSFIQKIKDFFNGPSLTDLALQDQPKLATLAQLNTANGQISTLTLNVKQIDRVVLEGQKIMSKIQSDQTEQTFAIATWAAQLDVKANIQLGIQILSDFILKLGSILLGAQSGKTSPFALNLKELLQLKHAVATKYKGTQLTNKLSHIKTSITTIGSELTLQFTIPISSSETEYTFYKVIPIPIFDGNQTFIPDSPFSNIALATHSHYYTTLSSEEFATCMGSPSICNTHFPMKYISTRFDCILTSYLDSKLTCPLKQISATPYPFLYFNDLDAVYSVPSKTSLRSTCIDSVQNRIDQIHEIQHVGKIKFKPNCKITATDSIYEFHYYTPKVAITENIAHWHTFENVKFEITPDTTYIVAPHVIHNMTSTNLTEIVMPTWEELLKDSFQPKSTLKVGLQILAIAIPIIIIIYLIKFLNSTQLCTAVKGAALNKVSATTARANRWRRKRCTDFQTHNDPPVRSESFTFRGRPIDPIMAAARLHSTSHPNIPFSIDHLHAQQRRANVQFANDKIYPDPTELEEDYVAVDPGVKPPPPAYTSPGILRNAPIHRYNTRSQDITVRSPASALPNTPNNFEMQ